MTVKWSGLRARAAAVLLASLLAAAGAGSVRAADVLSTPTPSVTPTPVAFSLAGHWDALGLGSIDIVQKGKAFTGTSPEGLEISGTLNGLNGTFTFWHGATYQKSDPEDRGAGTLVLTPYGRMMTVTWKSEKGGSLYNGTFQAMRVTDQSGSSGGDNGGDNTNPGDNGGTNTNPGQQTADQPDPFGDDAFFGDQTDTTTSGEDTTAGSGTGGTNTNSPWWTYDPATNTYHYVGPDDLLNGWVMVNGAPIAIDEHGDTIVEVHPVDATDSVPDVAGGDDFFDTTTTDTTDQTDTTTSGEDTTAGSGTGGTNTNSPWWTYDPATNTYHYVGPDDLLNGWVMVNGAPIAIDEHGDTIVEVHPVDATDSVPDVAGGDDFFDTTTTDTTDQTDTTTSGEDTTAGSGTGGTNTNSPWWTYDPATNTYHYVGPDDLLNGWVMVNGAPIAIDEHGDTIVEVHPVDATDSVPDVAGGDDFFDTTTTDTTDQTDTTTVDEQVALVDDALQGITNVVVGGMPLLTPPPLSTPSPSVSPSPNPNS